MLVLGPVAFEAFEVPAKIGFGGRQRIVVHTLPGGARVLDAMGRDDAPITWTGVFSGPGAMLRARLLDTLRSEGAAWTLAWDAFSFSVVVAEFQAQYERSNWIPYRISCTVLADNAAALLEAVAGLGGQMLSDLVAAGGFQGVDVSGVDTALLTSGLSGQAAAMTQLNSGISQGISEAGAALGNAGNVADAVAGAGALAQLAAARGYGLRAQAILQNQGG